MPATSLVVLERLGNLYAGLEEPTQSLPVQLIPARNQADWSRGLAKSPFPIGILEHSDSLGDIVPLVQECLDRHGQCLVIGKLPSLALEVELRERGVSSILPHPPSSAVWRQLIERLIELAQERVRLTG